MHTTDIGNTLIVGCDDDLCGVRRQCFFGNTHHHRFATEINQWFTGKAR
jgi:hypothetical protein